MVELSDPLPETLQPQELKALVAATPPCLTLFLPPHRPAGGSQPVAVLKALVHDLGNRLANLKVPEQQSKELLAPLLLLLDDAEFARGSHSGRVIFRSRDYLREFEIDEIQRAEAFAGGTFAIRALLNRLNMPPQFYILKLSKKRADLMRCGSQSCQPVPFPKGFPYTFEEAMAFEPPDHDLENRSPAGPSPASRRGIRFGTGSGKETEHTHLADFYKIVDRAIHQVQRDGHAPLVLAGVQEDTSMYRSVAAYPAMVGKSVSGSPDGGALTAQDLERQARVIVQAAETDRFAAELMDLKERATSARYTTNLWNILKAAAEGRVSKVYIDENADRKGSFQEVKRGDRWDWGEEDLLNLAAVETLAHGGQAFALPSSRMPDQAAVAAFLRY